MAMFPSTESEIASPRQDELSINDTKKLESEKGIEFEKMSSNQNESN